MFAQDVTTFLDCLNEFPEFTDEAVNAAILALEGDLKVRVQQTERDMHMATLTCLAVLGFLLEGVRRYVCACS